MKRIAHFMLQCFRLESILAIPFGWLYRRVFRQVGVGSFISPFVQVVGADCISIGEQSRISRNTRLLALKSYGAQIFNPHLRIGDNVSVGFGCTLSCVQRLEIGHDVTIGDNVYIADSHHDYRDPMLGILQQPLLPGQVSIGQGTWIGFGAFIAGDISIGQHAVIGANSVVTRSVEPFTVVAGVPARPVRRFDQQTATWVKMNANSDDSEKLK